MAKNRDLINKEYCFYVSHNSKKDFEITEAVNSIRLMNMKKTDYDNKNKNNLKFATFDNNPGPDPNLDFDLAASNLQMLSLKQQNEPYPKNYTSDCPDKLKYKLGLPVNNSFSSSSSEEIQKTKNFNRKFTDRKTLRWIIGLRLEIKKQKRSFMITKETKLKNLFINRLLT